jgi:signal transduction histidine kinase
MTLLFVLIFGTLLIVFSTMLYRTFIYNHQVEFDASLYNHAIDVAKSLSVGPLGDLTFRSEVLNEAEKVFPFALGNAVLQVRSLDGTIVARSRSAGFFRLPYDSAERQLLMRSRIAFRDVVIDGFDETRNFRQVSYLLDRRPGGPFVLQIAVPQTFLEQERKGLITYFVVSIPIILALGALGGLFLSTRALAPLRAIMQKAQAIGVEELSERVPVPDVDDEFKQLALTLNGLLGRLQQAFDSQERFVADASHQLKTPLAILKGELDLIRSRPRSETETREFFESAAQEVNSLSRTIEDLLMLARVDAGRASLSVQPVRLDEIVMSGLSRLEKLARAAGIQLALNLEGENFETRGDPDLLQGLVQNLVENAIKYSPEGARVEVRLKESADELSLSVRDSGPGIPDADLSRIFERFFRGSGGGGAGAAQGSRKPGSGLGLAIAKRIADAHGARLEVTSRPGQGSEFLAHVPRT